MDARVQLRVQRYGWDRAAAHYESAWSRALAPATAAVLQAVALRPGDRVLDVACGAGALTHAAWQAVAPGGGEVVGTDVSDHMLEQAARHAPGCRFLRADGGSLPPSVTDGGFDVVLCGMGLMYMPDPEQALAAMVACMRPGARLAVSVWGERRQCAWAEVFPIVDARVHSEVCPMFFRLGGEGALERALRGAGLGDVRTSRIESTVWHADAEAACHAAFEAGPVALAYSRFDAATRSAARAEYLESIEPWREGASYRLPGEFVIGSACLS